MFQITLIMKIRSFLFLALSVFLFGSCTMILVEEIRGGHSPMMQLDGEWGIEEYVSVENGVTTDERQADRVYLDATKDIGNYCQGTWMEIKTTMDDEFLWGIDEDGEQFTLQDNGQDVVWEVVEQEKKYFHVERTENGKTYRMKLTK